MLIICLSLYVINKFEEETLNTRIKDKFTDPATGRVTHEGLYEFLLARIISLTMMHLFLYKECQRGLKIMDYVSNHPSEFEMHRTAWTMGFLQASQYFTFEIMNSLLLLTRPDIRMVLSAYVNIYILYTVNRKYFANAIEDVNSQK